MKRLMSFLAVVTICCFTSSADAQVSMTDAEQSKDSIGVEAVSIADLEMIVPENRLMPESNPADAQSELVESPFSSTHPQRVSHPEGKLTARDLEMLENITPSEEAAEAPSR